MGASVPCRLQSLGLAHGLNPLQYRSDGFCQPTLKRWVVSIATGLPSLLVWASSIVTSLTMSATTSLVGCPICAGPKRNGDHPPIATSYNRDEMPLSIGHGPRSGQRSLLADEGLMPANHSLSARAGPPFEWSRHLGEPSAWLWRAYSDRLFGAARVCGVGPCVPVLQPALDASDGAGTSILCRLDRCRLSLPAFVGPAPLWSCPGSRVNLQLTAHANPAVIRESHREVQQGERAPRE